MTQATMILTVDDIPEMRKLIWLCREFRKDATVRKDYHMEVFAESMTRSARTRYRTALALLRCPH
jgi:hypothetical protein